MRCAWAIAVLGLAGVGGLLPAQPVSAQSFGIELYNTLMPASGGMGGASLARPQDVQSALNANPATLTQYRGTYFGFSGAWVEATQNLDYSGTSVPGLSPFSGKSGWPGGALGNIALSQDFSVLGLPVTAGIGMFTNAGAGSEFRAQPGSNGATLGYTALDMTGGASLLLTSRLSIGGAVGAGISTLDGPFVGSGAMTNAYGLRGTIGLAYDVTDDTTIGVYYQTKKHFQFSRAIQLLGVGPFLDISLDHPQNIGLGISNSSLMDGRLLLAVDVLYKDWSNTDLFRAIYEDQWVVITGAQLTRGCTKFRLGYAYAQNNMRQFVPSNAGGVPAGVAVIQFFEAMAPAITPHRLSAGIGRPDLLPGIDLDVFAGTMLEGSESFGDTFVSIKSYWIGGGLTWRFGRGACEYRSWCTEQRPCFGTQN